MVTQRLGRFMLLRKLGAGGMGTVFAAYDEQLDRRVALKLLHPREGDHAVQRQRVLREAQAMARLSHPNVVQVYEVEQIGSQIFIAMEYVEGMTLTQWTQQNHPWREVLHLYRQAGQGLVTAHQAGLVHRDFKPDNVLLGGDARPRVADFGLARAEGETAPAAPTADSPPVSPASGSGSLLASPLTMAGVVVGTPAYMSPEQHLGQPADARSDQFSFCVALYEALYKELPFAGETLAELSLNVIEGRLKPPSEHSEIPPPIGRALLRGLANKPADRFPSMAELLTALDFDPHRDATGMPRARRIFIGVTFATILGFTAWVTQKDTRQLMLRDLLAAGLSMFTILAVVALTLRKTLLRNLFHRGMVVACLIIMGQACVLRALAWMAGLQVAPFLPLELGATAAATATIAYHYLKGAWIAVALLACAALGAAADPAHSFMYAQFGYLLEGTLLIGLWIRAAGQRPAASTRAASSAPS